MFKRYFILLLGIIPILSFSQQELTLEKSVMAYYQGLYPKGISRLQFVEGVDNYMYYEKNAYYIKKASNQQLVMKLDLRFFKKDFPKMTKVPYISKINTETIVFSIGNTTTIYQYAGSRKGKKIEIETPKEAANKKFNLKMLLPLVAGFIFFFIASAPVWIWNYQNDFISFKFQTNHGLGGTEWEPKWTMLYLAGQFLLVFPMALWLGRKPTKQLNWLFIFAWAPLAFFFFKLTFVVPSMLGKLQRSTLPKSSAEITLRECPLLLI